MLVHIELRHEKWGLFFLSKLTQQFSKIKSYFFTSGWKISLSDSHLFYPESLILRYTVETGPLSKGITKVLIKLQIKMPKVHTKIVQKKTPRSVGVQEKWSAGVHVAYGVWACTLWQGAGISLIHWETLSLIIPEPCPFKQLWAASRGFNSDCAAFDYNYTPLTLQETLLIVPKRNTFLSKHQTHFPLCLSQWFHGLIFILRYKIK